MLVIVDYGMGNLRSVEKKLKRIGANVCISSDIDIIKHATKLILPGVGHFANGVKKLKETNIWDTLNETVLINKIPILGICLGMQLMASYSEEGNVEGFGWFDADVVRFNIKNKLKYKVPHMGWNSVIIEKESEILIGLPNDSLFYFVHSYYVRCNNQSDILTTSEYEFKFTSAIQKENIFGTQFHPEKSHDIGEQVFRNFVNF